MTEDEGRSSEFHSRRSNGSLAQLDATSISVASLAQDRSNRRSLCLHSNPSRNKTCLIKPGLPRSFTFGILAEEEDEVDPEKSEMIKRDFDGTKSCDKNAFLQRKNVEAGLITNKKGFIQEEKL